MLNKSVNRIIVSLPYISVLALVFVLATVRIADNDVWWHLKCGELFLRNGWIPRTDIFSYTALGEPWVDGYLPAQALYYLAWEAAGSAGVVLLGSVLVTSTFILALLFSKKLSSNGSVASAVAVAIALPAAVLSINCMFPRPALLTPIFALVNLYFLEDFRKNGGRWIFLLLPITALWANCHPAFFIGPIITAIFIIGCIRVKDIRKTLAFVFGGQLVATLINPYGYKVYYSALSLFSNSKLKNEITEWRPLYSRSFETVIIYPAFIIVVALGMMFFIWKLRKSRMERVIMFLFTAAISISGRRNLFLFGALSMPLIAWTISDKLSEMREKRDYLRHAKFAGGALVTVISLFLIWFSATDRLYYHTQLFRSTGLGIQTSLFPEKATELLENERIKGNVFHAYGIGGYLIFKLFPDYRVFIDGRIFPYPYGIFRAGTEALDSPAVFERLKRQYDIRAALLPVYPPMGGSPLLRALVFSPNWAVVSAETAGVLLLERNAGNDEIIARHELNILNTPPDLPTRPPVRKFHLWDRAEVAHGPIWWGMFYERSRLIGLAADVLKESLNYRPVPPDTEAGVAGLLIRSGRLEEGHELVERALAADPGDPTALRVLADYYSAKGDWAEAEKPLLQLLKSGKPSYNLLEYLGDIAYNRRDYATAASRYREAISINPGSAILWENLGDSLVFVDKVQAVQAYSKSLQIMQSTGAPAQDIRRIEDRMR